MQTLCQCMFTEQSDGSSRCRQCGGDIYACECPVRHSIRCESHPENLAKAREVHHAERMAQYYDYHN